MAELSGVRTLRSMEHSGVDLGAYISCPVAMHTERSRGRERSLVYRLDWSLVDSCTYSSDVENSRLAYFEFFALGSNVNTISILSTEGIE
jgi:hypothetical protein